MLALEELRAELEEISKITDQEWMGGLNERKRLELEFHDRHRDRSAGSLEQDTYEKLYGNRKYYAATRDSTSYAEGWIEEHARGRVFLDYACGDGHNAIRAALAGAKLAIGIDLSRVSIENATRDAAAAGVEANTMFLQADAESTRFPNACVDTAICSGMLHHLDLSYALPELRRVVAPGGRVLCHEALDYNPAIKLYRRLTPAMRTDYEMAHILSLKDLRFAEHFFELGEVRFWHMLGVLTPHAPYLGELLRVVDRALTRLPLLQLMSWMFTFELIRRDD